ncbi:hypothetical protein HNP38_003162 [Chryseobacterium defluvii]|uniref:DUF4270 domain-containing protein n=1 Tax=Chryseobacterium defluvii TaxID=160396 RepID=A0A840KF78_9FLAO|nr:DUF4270 family protein [Chryseobacterium defluvii]MBB4807846.1 hypothetical protein [Chryseobacterium defluvii]
MTYTIKRTFAILFLAIFGSVLLYNCEPDPDSLGEQLFLDGAAQGNETSYDVIAYNIYNKDSIRSDASKLGGGVLGAFNEGQFGMQKASYFTQLRLSTYDPDFGTNAEVDSVVLAIKPTAFQYAQDTVTTTTDENYIFPDGNVAAKKVVNSYPIKKYGKAKIGGTVPQFTIKVHEVTEFLNGSSDVAYSNTAYTIGQELGSKVFNGNVTAVTITKDSDNSSLFSSAAGIRIPLSSSFFKSKIINMKGKPELKDVSNFIRYFRGLKISVVENDGYLFQFSPNDLELTMYYRYDKTENGVTTRPQVKYTFPLGSGNAHIGHYEYDRTGAQFLNYVSGNTDTGDQKLYAQGMGGPSIGIKYKKEEIDKLRQLYQTEKVAIISAKIRIYTDLDNWKNKYTKPVDFTFVQKDKDSNGKETTNFTTDLLNLSGSINFAMYKLYNLDKDQASYEFTVTKSVKDIVEGGENYANKYFKIDLGSFLTTTTGALVGYQYTSRNFARDRAVFVGSDPNNVKKIQLIVTYGKK